MHQTLRPESRASQAVSAVAVLLQAAVAFAAQVDPPAVEWEKTWLAGKIQNSNAIIQTADGGYIATGEIDRGDWRITDICLVRGDGDGNLLWSKTYHAQVTNLAIALCLSDDGGYVVAPWTWDDKTLTRRLIKFDAEGNLVWDRVYSQVQDRYLHWSGIANTLNGGYVLTGFYDAFGPGVLAATDGNGVLLWERPFMESPGATLNQPFDVVTTADGEYVATGNTIFTEGVWTPYLARFSSDGSVKWEKIIPLDPTLTYTLALRVRQERDGGFIVAGDFLARIDEEGNTLWSKRLLVPPACEVCETTWIEPTSDGGYIMVGDGANPPPWIAKYDGNGDFVWMKYPPDFVNFRCVRQTKDGGYILYGHGNGEANGLHLMKFAPESTTITFRRGRFDGDDGIDLADAICLLGYLFEPTGAPCEQAIVRCLDAADANDDGGIDISDPITILAHLFMTAGSLPEPFGACGSDPTADALGCIGFSPCVGR